MRILYAYMPFQFCNYGLLHVCIGTQTSMYVCMYVCMYVNACIVHTVKTARVAAVFEQSDHNLGQVGQLGDIVQ
jgi:hypothetical protein